LISLVVGPWAHGQWVRAGDHGNLIGSIVIGNHTSDYFRELHRSFFYDHLWRPTLETVPADAPPPYAFAGKAHIFTTGDRTWQTFPTWPPKTTTFRDYYLLAGEALDTIAPLENTTVCYVSDPFKPVPYVTRPIQEFWRDENAKVLYKVNDQRLIDGRPDVLLWESSPLQNPVTIQGRIVMTLYASTTGSDLDFIVKLVDIYPQIDLQEPWMNGYRFPVTDTIIRGKYRENITDPTPLVPDEVTEFTIDLLTRSHTFLPGHQIMIQISSTAFPLFDPNPQTFVNISAATKADYQVAAHCIHQGVDYPSKISLPILAF